MSFSSSQLPKKEDSAFPFELVEFSSKVEAERISSKDSRIKNNLDYHFREEEYYGAQLIPLNKRDLKALSVLFEIEDIESIQQDVSKALLALWPAPCWEDDPFDVLDQSYFDFLADFL